MFGFFKQSTKTSVVPLEDSQPVTVVPKEDNKTDTSKTIKKTITEGELKRVLSASGLSSTN